MLTPAFTSLRMHRVGASTPIIARSLLKFATAAVLFLALSSAGAAATDSDWRGRQFIGIEGFGDFSKSTGTNAGETIFTSPEISAAIDFTELIISWDAQIATNSSLVVQARALYPQSATKYYTLGIWSPQSGSPRHSVSNQGDQHGKVSTDTLLLNKPSRRFQLQYTLLDVAPSASALRFIGISLCDPNVPLKALQPDKSAWDKILPVPERSQMPYPDGKVWCSPTTISMLLAFWSQKLNRPELDRTVPEVANGVYDSEWKGTGNWPFNTAYPGSFTEMRAYVSRLSDVSELEAWIARGIPVGLSLDYDRLRAKGPGPNGHLVVCVGFTRDGDAVINDPGTSEHVRKIFPRANLVDAWSCSHNTVYLVYPENLSPPQDFYGHWASAKTRF